MIVVSTKARRTELFNPVQSGLRLPYRDDAKIAEICNLWKFWLVSQLINHLFKIQKKALLPNALYMEKMQ